MGIFRQHAETELREIVGKECLGLIAVPTQEENVVYSLYMKIQSIWLRIFIQAELLFVDECSGPDPEDDLCEGQEYLDFGDSTLTSKSLIQSAEMRDGVFRVCLSHDISFELSEVESGTKIFFRKSNIGSKGCTS